MPLSARRVSALVLGLLLALALASCSRPDRPRGAGDPCARLLARTDEMIAILRENRGDPARARRELAAYQQVHAAELAALKQAMADLMQREPLEVAPASAAYGLRSAELDMLTQEVSRAAPRAP